jgi:hypothetical protein
VGRFVALALCAGAAAGVAGCGSSTVTSVVDPVAQAATISNKATGMRLTLAMRLSASALPAPITGSGGGVVDLVNHSGSLSLTMDLGSIPQVTALLGTGKLRIDEIERGSTFYLKLPPPLNRSPALHGKPWAKVNLTSAGNALGMSSFSSMLNNPASSDPSQLLRYLRATSGTVTKVGKQNVDGFNTTHYRARIELDRVPNAFPSSERAQVRRTIESLEQVAHLHAIPVDVWIDQQHLVRRMELSFAENVSGQGLTVGIRVDIPQYGPQSPPQPPPAGEVADLTTGLGTSTSTGASPVGG